MHEEGLAATGGPEETDRIFPLLQQPSGFFPPQKPLDASAAVQLRADLPGVGFWRPSHVLLGIITAIFFWNHGPTMENGNQRHLGGLGEEGDLITIEQEH